MPLKGIYSETIIISGGYAASTAPHLVLVYCRQFPKRCSYHVINAFDSGGESIKLLYGRGES